MGIEILGNTFNTRQAGTAQQADMSAVAAAAVSAPVARPVTQVTKGDTNGQNDQQPDEKQIKAAINDANRRAKFGQASAQFSYHEKTKRIAVKIVDNDTNEVIREIPPEETLEMISKMWELAGIMVDEKR